MVPYLYTYYTHTYTYIMALLLMVLNISNIMVFEYFYTQPLGIITISSRKNYSKMKILIIQHNFKKSVSLKFDKLCRFIVFNHVIQ